MGLSTDRGDRPRLIGRGHERRDDRRDDAATGGMTVATTGATGEMTARTADPDPDCSGDSSTPGRAQGE
jgi:hypothetical protein